MRPTYPGVRPPDRRRTVIDGGPALAVHEWGAAEAPPVLLAHGAYDFARTFDGFAPKLADAGWRVVCWDQRGHGDSDHSALYSRDADVRDALRVLDSTTREPMPFVGHSKGARMLMELADANPHRCSHLVNLEGLLPPRNLPEIADDERTRVLAREWTRWLDHRAAAASRRPHAGTIDELATRRKEMNPRLPLDWLRYLVPLGAEEVEPGRYRWKLDPAVRPAFRVIDGVGPSRPEWSIMRLPGLAMPVLGVLGLEREPVGWGTPPEDVHPWLPAGGELIVLDGVGHFVHIEESDKVAELVLDFLGLPPAAGSAWAPVSSEASAPPVVALPEPRTPITFLRHHRVQLALHELRAGDGRALLHLHGLGERSPTSLPSRPSPLALWPGPIFALDFTGHGLSTVPVGGGYTSEMLMADADTALRHLSEATVYGRGLGAYVALLLAGARPDAVHGAVLADGPGLLGGGQGPGSSVIRSIQCRASAPPDPFVLSELAREVWRPDYARSFVRLALDGSPLEHPLVVSAVNRPEWLAAVVSEAGVLELPAPDALELYASA